tara:strand:- start:69 stop:629 length:561 start_codon:yes stop_codon:yes gene_type:complete
MTNKSPLLSRLLVAAAMSICISSQALALSATEAIVMQWTLTDHGYDIGELDGVIGKRTMQAIQSFSEKHGSPTDPEKLGRWFRKTMIQNREEITDPEYLEKIRNAVGDDMKDPSSAIIKDVFLNIGPRGRFICGEVNGKNSYGAYSGYTSFHSLSEELFGGLPLFIVDGEPYGISFYRCSYAVPQR